MALKLMLASLKLVSQNSCIKVFKIHALKYLKIHATQIIKQRIFTRRIRQISEEILFTIANLHFPYLYWGNFMINLLSFTFVSAVTELGVKDTLCLLLACVL